MRGAPFKAGKALPLSKGAHLRRMRLQQTRAPTFTEVMKVPGINGCPSTVAPRGSPRPKESHWTLTSTLALHLRAIPTPVPRAPPPANPPRALAPPPALTALLAKPRLAPATRARRAKADGTQHQPAPSAAPCVQFPSTMPTTAMIQPITTK